ncbi:MAG TPA: 2OG-Fe(II) oxygenase [Longimicrobiales bacterium]|nr:2OG-Fe(II) oxygenase [Longimicrobiales bacterium]
MLDMRERTTERIGEVLAGIDRGSAVARHTTDASDLRIDVRGVGPLRLPVTSGQAKRLCSVARPARFGRGEETVRDAHVRDTWVVPKSRVKIDARRWNRTLLPVLDRLRDELGLPEGSRLKAELHAMLVYAPGQFFLPHQDSEKSDDMVGTLVVTLPSSFRGGALVIEHRGTKVVARGSKRRLSFVAFYADCRHEVQPVKEGFRVVLTYNLSVEGDTASVVRADPATVDVLTGLLRDHFETPRPPHDWSTDRTPREPPRRLVCLLDHEYTERGLGWERLKGSDRARATALLAVAEQADCDAFLALGEIEEVRQPEPPEWDEPWRRSWYADDDAEDDIEGDPASIDPDDFASLDLVSGSTTLRVWIPRGAKRRERIDTYVDDDEICAATPTAALRPYESEYTPFMGNWGNTIDRWYRRAAIVLSPSGHAFAVRAEASPAWAAATLKKRIGAGSIAEARALAKQLLPFWDGAVRGVNDSVLDGLFGNVMIVAEAFDDPTLAASLLEPFDIEALSAKTAPAFAALVARYDGDWVRALLADRPRHDLPSNRDRAVWISRLPALCRALRKTDVAAAAAHPLLESSWRWIRKRLARPSLERRPALGRDLVKRLPGPTLGVIRGTIVADASELRREIISFLTADEDDVLVPFAVRVVRLAIQKKADDAIGALELLRQHCIEQLEARLATPPRDADDWSLHAPRSCDCALCDTLHAFVEASDRRTFEWPLAKRRRQHVHRAIDALELPVRHETRREGRPFTLVLTKTPALFDREVEKRKAWRTDLEFLAGSGP